MTKVTKKGRSNVLRRSALFLLLACIIFLILIPLTAGRANDPVWEYRVVILQGVTSGGSIERDNAGNYVDLERTRVLNTLAADGWEVVAVLGAVTTDHSVYMRRAPRP